MSVKSVLLSNHLMLCRSFLLFPSVFPSIRVFSNELALCIRWPKHWSFSFSISPSNEYSGLISFRVDWFDLLTVQGTHKSLLQHRNLKASVLQCSAFFMVPSSYPYMTTGKYHSFDYTDLCQLFNMVSGLVTASLPRSKRLLIMTAVIILSDFGAQGNKICHCFRFFPFYLPQIDGTRCYDLSFLNAEFQVSFFHSSLAPTSRGSFVPLHFLPLEWYHLQLKMEKLCTVSKNKTWSSDHELLIAKFGLKSKNVGETTRPFMYDLNQIPCDYTVEGMNRFGG